MHPLGLQVTVRAVLAGCACSAAWVRVNPHQLAPTSFGLHVTGLPWPLLGWGSHLLLLI